MDTAEIQIGSTITNGSSAIRVTARLERDPRWGTPSWQGHSIPLEKFGGNPGTLTSVPDYLLGSWGHVPFEWRTVTGGGVQERYVWTSDWRRLEREVRAIVPDNRKCAECLGDLEDPAEHDEATGCVRR